VRTAVRSCRSFAVFGAGSVGLSALLAAGAAGCSPLVAVDPSEHRRRVATGLGATDVVDPSDGDVVESIAEITNGGSWSVVDATGVAAVAVNAFDSLAVGGTLVIVGVPPGQAILPVNITRLLGGRAIRGAIQGDAVPQDFIPRLIAMWRAGEFPFDRLITQFSFESINEALARAESGEVLKPVLVWP
jgi:aryl-alcohol dehydrogenase